MVEFFLHSFNNVSHILVGYVIPFLFVLTIVVFFHELGHFLVARWAGVKVLTFSLGFGPELAELPQVVASRTEILAVMSFSPIDDTDEREVQIFVEDLRGLAVLKISARYVRK